MDLAHLERYLQDGYAVLRNVFRPDEVAEMAAAFDRVRAEARRQPRSDRHGNVHFRVAGDGAAGRLLGFVQWPAYCEPARDRVRLDRRFAAMLAPLIGGDLKQIINQLHWKPPGAAAEFGWHQDIRFRRPRHAYRAPALSYVQTGIAVDAHSAENGAMTVIPGSHRLGELALGSRGPVLDTALADADLARLGIDPAAAVTLELAPGDVALGHLHLLHGSGPNRTAPGNGADAAPGGSADGAGTDRRFYLNGYVAAAKCDRGVAAFRAGEPVPLPAEPVLIHWEHLHARPEPHYVEE